MLRRFVVFAVLFVVSAFAQQFKPPAPKPQGVTVDDVISLAAAGLSDDLIATQLRKEGQPFDLSTDDLLRLKKANVSDSVIRVMMGPNPQPSGATFLRVARGSNDPLMRRNGIYLYTTESDGKLQLTRLKRAAFQGMSSGGLGNALTFGIKKEKTRAVIGGPRAGVRVENPNTEFYFYFEDQAAGKGDFGPFAVGSPNQFALLKLEVAKSDRETVMGEGNGFGSVYGPDQKSMIAFRSQMIRDGLYKVVTNSPLQPGEYCFVAPQGAAGVWSGEMFDFGVGR